MIPLRLLNIQGIAGLALSLALGLLLLIQKGETRHWKKESGHFEQLYSQEQSALSAAVANYRAAAAQAEAADQANLARVTAAQRTINERTSDEFEARLAAARAAAAAQRLRVRPEGSADPRRGAAAPVSALSAAPGGPHQAAGEDRLPNADALTATEQAIQLDELIKWVERQHGVDPNVAH
jgi:hypothetical protein